MHPAPAGRVPAARHPAAPPGFTRLRSPIFRTGRRCLVFAALLTALTGGLLTGCGDTGAPAAAAERTLTVATADDVKSLDPAQAFDTWSTAVVHACTRRLVDYDMRARLVPDLAERWEEGDGGRTYTFHLRPGIVFADGRPIEARHFQAAVKRVLDPAAASPGASFYGAISAVEAAGPRRLVVRLKTPDPTLLNGLGMTFAAPLQEGTPEDRPSASGPYTVAEYEPGTRVVLVRNPRDRRNPSRLERIVLQLGVEESLQLTRFRGGEVDLLAALPAAEYGRIMEDPTQRARVAQGVVNQTWYFGMNLSRRPWSDPRVRRAALLALDRLRNVLLAGPGQLAHSVLPPFVPGFDPARRLPGRDLDAARRLLAEAGYPHGVPHAERSVLWLPNNDQAQRQAESIQSDLREAGIPVELRPVPLSEYLTGYRTSAGCWFGGWYPDFPDAGNFLEPVLHGKSIQEGKSPNAARYRNLEFDRLLDEAHAAPIGPRRAALYRRAEDLLMRDLPWIPLYFEVESRYFRPGVTGVVVHPVWRQMLTGIDRQPGRAS